MVNPESASITTFATLPSFMTIGTLSSLPLNQLLNQVTSIKMDRSNFLLWQNLAWPILRSYKLEGYLTGEKPWSSRFIPKNTNGEEESSAATSSGAETEAEQQLNLAFDAWVAVNQLLLGWLYNYMSPEIATQQTRKGALKMGEYLALMKKYFDGLALAGSPVSVDDLVSQILSGLDEEYNPVIVAIQGKTGVRWSDMQSNLLSYEEHLIFS